MVMKKLVKRYAKFSIILSVYLICTSCSGEKENDTIKEHNYEDNQDHGQEQEKAQAEATNSVNASDIITDTNETDMSAEVSGSEDEIGEEFLHNFYDFTEQTSAHVFRDNVSENQIYAPLNWYLTLSMLGELSGEEAGMEIQKVMGISEFNASDVNNAISTLEKSRINLGRLKINTSLWLNNDLIYQEALLTKLKSEYQTEIYQGNLKDSEFQNKMTEWVSENTSYEFKPDYHKSIDMADPYAFVSLNTLDFYNEWLFPFEEEDTFTDLFFVSDNNEISCEFMKMENPSYPFMIGEDFISSICILKENESMLFILPEEGLSVENFLEIRGKLSGIISDWTKEQFTMGKIKLSVPKFSYVAETNLKTTAEAMGIKKIFDSNAKAFSGFTDENVYISDITQASKIAIDEKGCSASSYTEIVAYGSGVWMDEAEIILNRPFIYVLYKDKLPFLVGIVRNPLTK